MIARTTILIYGLISYALAVASLGYAILFVGNVGVSPSLDTVRQTDPWSALLIDLGLLAAFAIQHSVMARPAFKRLWTRVVPAAAERSTYVLASGLLLGALVYFWQPLGGVLWQFEAEAAIVALYALFAMGWALVLVSTFQIDHFDLFGLRQVWLHFRGEAYRPRGFVKPFLYRYVRHPLYVGLLIGIWAAPTMTVAHLVFAAMCTAYIAIGTRLEERDLEAALPEYAEYKKAVPMFLPSAERKPAVEGAPVNA